MHGLAAVLGAHSGQNVGAPHCVDNFAGAVDGYDRAAVEDVCDVVEADQAEPSFSAIASLSLQWVVEAICLQPVPRSYVRVKARVARHRSVEFGQTRGGQLR